MPASSKQELLSVTQLEFARLERVLEQVGAELAYAKDDDDTSIKDVIGHRAHWISLFLGWYKDGQAGKEVFFPAKGYKWNELKRYNALLREEQSELSFEEVIELLHRNSDLLIDFLNSHSDDELYSGPMKGAKNNWTTGRWAEAAGASHYRSAAKYIRSRIRESKA